MPFLNQRLITVAKIVVTLTLFCVIYWQLKDFKGGFNPIFPLSAKTWIGIMLILVLAPVNWILESIKWKTILSSNNKITTFEAWQAVLTGYTLGLITPAKVGDYIGRATQFKGRSVTALTATFHSSLWQNLANLIGGVLGVSFLLFRYHNNYLKLVLVPSVILLLLLTIFLTYADGRKKLTIWGFRFVKNHLKFIPLQEDLLNQLPAYNPFKTLFYSILRYTVYVVQYYICAISLGINSDFVTLFSIICSALMIQSMVPLPFVAGLLSRAQINILIWGLIGVSIQSAVIISLFIWMINIVLPALLGMNFVYRKKSFVNPLIN